MIFDAVRTPRGKGKKDGSLHEVKPIDLLAGLLVKLQKRHGFDPGALDDVVMGVVSPVGEQGSVIAKTAALKAGWDVRVAGMQINRFCASGLEAVNIAAQKVNDYFTLASPMVIIATYRSDELHRRRLSPRLRR
jgi:acetyl-CoA C-acetyltransferase